MNPYYSPVAGLKALEMLHDCKCLGSYLLVLAHDILENKSEYAEFFEQLRFDFQGKMFIILDNSAIELGGALPAKYLGAAAKIVKASCIILPDVLNSAEDTVRASFAGARSLKRSGDFGDCAFMVVPQGNSVPQLYWCIQQLSLIPNVRYWGVPRSITNTLGSREVLAEILTYNHVGPSGPSIHMLGMSSNLLDDIWCSAYPNVMGIDSANPIVMGLKNANLAEGHDHMARPKDYLSLDTLPTCAIDNVKYIRDMLAAVSMSRQSVETLSKTQMENYISTPGHA